MILNEEGEEVYRSRGPPRKWPASADWKNCPCVAVGQWSLTSALAHWQTASVPCTWSICKGSSTKSSKQFSLSYFHPFSPSRPISSTTIVISAESYLLPLLHLLTRVSSNMSSSRTQRPNTKTTSPCADFLFIHFIYVNRVNVMSECSIEQYDRQLALTSCCMHHQHQETTQIRNEMWSFRRARPCQTVDVGEVVTDAWHHLMLEWITLSTALQDVSD